MEPGEVIDGRYKIIEPLGEGGMGAVFIVEHVHMRKRMALKVLRAEMVQSEEIIARFEREAMAAAHIDHPNVASATDFGHTHAGELFMVLEYIDGQSLRAAIDQGPLGEARALHVARQIASALAKAHELGIVHRDLKPENVMLVTRDGSELVKVLDFGIAKLNADALKGSAPPGQKVLTQVGAVFGTPEYMPPEQAQGQAVDARADLYSLGVVSYQLLTGRLPYEANSLSELALKQQREPPPPVDELNPRVPPELADAVAGALALDQEERPASAALLAEAIAAGARGIEPAPTARTRNLGGTAATRMLSAGGAPTAQTRVAPIPAGSGRGPATTRTRQLEPRRAVYPPPMNAYGPDEAYRGPAPRQRSGGGRAARRFLAFVGVVLLFAAAVAVAVTIAANASKSVVHYQRVVAHDTNTAVKKFQDLINQYTK